MTSYQVLLFDLDGTLTDSGPGITKSVQYALAQFGIIEPDLAVLAPFVGPPLTDSFQNRYGFDEAQAQQALQLYREHFAGGGMYDNAVYPGIPELLETLAGQGKRLMIATSKPTYFAEPILAHFQLDRYFERIAGSSLEGKLSEKAEVIASLLAEYPEIDRRKVVMIGDRKHDIIGARDNGIDSIAVNYGYAVPGELQAAAPTYLVHTVQELGQLLCSATAL
ncbi:MAG TPA: HAD family hydrolase [Ktedonosporobacter sp.]|nr:HAD family hydrolase [Ktedonosporobacter sp.]